MKQEDAVPLEEASIEDIVSNLSERRAFVACCVLCSENQIFSLVANSFVVFPGVSPVVFSPFYPH